MTMHTVAVEATGLGDSTVDDDAIDLLVDELPTSAALYLREDLVGVRLDIETVDEITALAEAAGLLGCAMRAATVDADALCARLVDNDE